MNKLLLSLWVVSRTQRPVALLCSGRGLCCPPSTWGRTGTGLPAVCGSSPSRPAACSERSLVGSTATFSFHALCLSSGLPSPSAETFSTSHQGLTSRTAICTPSPRLLLLLFYHKGQEFVGSLKKRKPATDVRTINSLVILQSSQFRYQHWRKDFSVFLPSEATGAVSSITNSLAFLVLSGCPVLLQGLLSLGLNISPRTAASFFS